MKYHEKYPVTLKRAKELARIRLGRLPRHGYSVVIGGVLTGITPFRHWDYMLSLANSAGKFYLYAWIRPFSNPDMDKFQTIEFERDNRS